MDYLLIVLSLGTTNKSKREGMVLLFALTLYACLASTGSCVRRASMKALATNAVGLDNAGITAVCMIQPGTLEAKCWDNCYESRVPKYCGLPSPPPVGVAFEGISGGWYFTCGLTYAGHKAVCWGSDFVVLGGQYKNVSYSLIASGGQHACALKEATTPNSNNVDCWGRNFVGEGTPPNGTFVSLSSGNNFTCGLMQDNKARCWGSQDIQANVPRDVEFEEIYGGRGHICGIIKDTREIKCWGADPTDPSLVPPTGFNFSMLTAGDRHSCGLREDNQQVVCWGDIDPSSIAGIPFATIASGSPYACGVRLDLVNQVMCWGHNVKSPPVAQFQSNLEVCTGACQLGEYQVHDKDVGISQCPSGGGVCLDCPSCTSCGVPLINCSRAGLNGTLPPTNGDYRHHKSGRGQAGIIIGCVVGGFVIIGAAAAAVLVTGKGQRGLNRGWPSVANRVRRLRLHELKVATNNFSDDMVVGEGGFGKVYKGSIEVDGAQRLVAIKKAGQQGHEPSLSIELGFLSRLHHKYLVNLVGYCEEAKLLVLDFMANGSLHSFLFNGHHTVEDSWYIRLKMASQAARGLEYLHAHANPPVIHRDVKLANILLDERWDAHICDFGISKQVMPASATHLSNVSIAGTPGFLDPQYYSTGQLTAKSDVYSFGVVLLVLLTGKRATILEEMIPSFASSASSPLEQVELDERLTVLSDVGPLEQALELARMCLQEQGRDRPSMTQVVVRLDAILEELMPHSGPHSRQASGVSVLTMDSQLSTMSLEPR